MKERRNKERLHWEDSAVRQGIVKERGNRKKSNRRRESKGQEYCRQRGSKPLSGKLKRGGKFQKNGGKEI